MRLSVQLNKIGNIKRNIKIGIMNTQHYSDVYVKLANIP